MPVDGPVLRVHFRALIILSSPPKNTRHPRQKNTCHPRMLLSGDLLAWCRGINKFNWATDEVSAFCRGADSTQGWQ